MRASRIRQPRKNFREPCPCLCLKCYPCPCPPPTPSLSPREGVRRTGEGEFRRFMVPMQAEKIRKRALHEPTVWCPGFSRSGPPEGGTPNKFCRTVRFKVPMHGTKVEGAFHEP